MPQFLSDTLNTLKKPNRWIFTTWFKFLTRYRRTSIGPLWIIASPILFIGFLGLLFVGLSGFTTSEFIPHLTIGFVGWTLLGGYLMRSHTIFSRNRAHLLQGEIIHTDILLFDNAELIVHFLHQCILVLAVCYYYGTIESAYSLISLLGLALIIVNGYSLTLIFGIVGARYKDFGEMISSITSIAFLATPIIWMPVEESSSIGGKGGILQAYMTFNPFYHFLEVFRAPLLSQPIEAVTWVVVISFTLLGYLIAEFFYRRYRHMISIWV